jgi:hypothetical protein
MRFATCSLSCLSLIFVGCSSYNTPKQGATVPTAATATPMFSIAAGTYPTAQQVAISDATAGAIIYYMRNGTPLLSLLPSTPRRVVVSSTGALIAAAIAAGYTLSALALPRYIISPPPPRVLAAPSATGRWQLRGSRLRTQRQHHRLWEAVSPYWTRFDRDV